VSRNTVSRNGVSFPAGERSCTVTVWLVIASALSVDDIFGGVTWHQGQLIGGDGRVGVEVSVHAIVAVNPKITSGVP
jgi:hypothetical protein